MALNPIAAVHSIVSVITEPRVFLPALFVAWLFSGRLRATLKRRARERAVRNWPPITATIEVAAVLTRPVTEKTSVYTASLTYFYRNPNLQMGEYTRPFGSKEQARAWATQFKGRTVLVHVNPDDLTDSVLLERDLAGNDLVTHLPTPSPTEDWMVVPHVISPGFRMLCAISEIVGLAGLATSVVLLGVSIVTHGKLGPRQYLWVGGFMLGWCWLSAIAINVHLRRTEEGRWLLRSYKRWCPGWMRWALNLTGGIGVFAPLSHFFNLLDMFGHLTRYLSHQPWAQALAPHLPYVIGCWVFFVTTAFLAAILRSQEELRILVGQT
ncbi:MAG: hypothetical protein ABR928_14385 [Terracidiphilus sp.]